MKNFFIGMLLLVSTVLLPGCSNSTNKADQATTNENNETLNAAATDSTQLLAYVCPMRCEGSGSNEPGKCKVCDMDLIKNPEPHQDLVAPPAH